MRKIDEARVSDQQIKKSDDIAQKLASRIVRGEFQPGEKLRQNLIAHEFGVSQVTAREALLRLAAQGLAISLPRRGICVASMDRNAVEELQVMRVALEPVALQRSVPNLTSQQIALVEQRHDECNGALTALEWEEANRRFHMEAIAACRMPRMIAEINNLQLLYAWHFNRRHSARWRQRDDPDHAAILAAIKDRDAERARTVMQRHLARLP